MQSRLPVIEVMRGLASVSVALFHFSSQMTSATAHLITLYGWLGVDVFFVISGFVIPLSLYGRDYTIRAFPRFMLRRMIRIDPPYLVSMALAPILWKISSFVPSFNGIEPDYSAGQVAAHLFYAVPLTNYQWISYVYWSLAFEFVFYIFCGLTLPYLFKRSVSWTIVVSSAFILIWFLISNSPNVARGTEFMVGGLLMRLVVAPDTKSRIEAASWIAICVSLLFHFQGAETGAAVFLAVTLILFLKQAQFGAWIYWLGGISYSLYLTHAIIGVRVIHLTQRIGDFPDVVLLMIALVVCVAFATLFSKLVEIPALNASKRIRI